MGDAKDFFKMLRGDYLNAVGGPSMFILCWAATIAYVGTIVGSFVCASL